MLYMGVNGWVRARIGSGLALQINLRTTHHDGKVGAVLGNNLVPLVGQVGDARAVGCDRRNRRRSCVHGRSDGGGHVGIRSEKRYEKNSNWREPFHFYAWFILKGAFDVPGTTHTTFRPSVLFYFFLFGSASIPHLISIHTSQQRMTLAKR